MRTAVLLVGDELLAGVVADRNGAAIARALAARGAPVDRVEMVGDERDSIAARVRSLAARHDLLVVAGGLGPTEDDVTGEAIALACGGELPADAASVDNPVGSAAGLRLRCEGCDLWVLPGVPAEVDGMLPAVLAGLPEADAGLVRERVVATAGIPEVRLAERVVAAGFAPPPGVRLSYLPAPGSVRLRLAAPAGVPPADLDAAAARLREIAGVAALPAESLAASLVAVLAEAGRTLATAESCTGGLIGGRMTDVPGASSVYLGGVIAYADRAKVERLGVDPALLQRHGAVSEETALSMARGCRERFGADLAAAVTGVAGPGGGTPVNPVGTVWIALADAAGAAAEVFRFGGPRELVRERTVNKTLEMAYRRLREGPA
jgi:nicotinamide-nucleotide amidase